MDKLYFNGDILTLEDDLYAEAVLVKDQRIYRVGKTEELKEAASKDVILVDLNGRTLMPSFIDAHSHFSGYASSFSKIDLSEVTNFSELKEAVIRFIQKNQIPAGQWIQGTGYDQNFFDEKKHPDKSVLDEAAPDHPVFISHQSGHMGVMNTKALDALSITADTKAPEGGRIEVIDGKLTGYVEENAYMHYIKSLPMVSNEEFMQSLMKAQKAYASYGITTVQEGFVVAEASPIFQYLMQTEQLYIDLIGYMDISNAEQIREKFADCQKQYHNHIKMNGYKMFLDGSPQGRTAWMRTPYQGDATYCGYGTRTDEEVKEALAKALTEDMQIIIHCNGDAACHQYIMAYQKALNETKSVNQIRPVIIHAQLLGIDQLDCVKELSMIPSFFVAHVYYWGDIHIKNFGYERASRISPAASCLKKGIRFTFHQDTPVIEPDMLETIWCATNRVTKDGTVIGPEERISPLEAVKAVTCNAAYQYFEEDQKGTIKEGKLADLIILDRNILKSDPMTIKDIQVLETIKEGKTIYKK